MTSFEQQQELIPLAPGEYLKQQRILKKITLSEVAKAINFDEKLLNEIELGGADHIALIYRKGYIKAYANYLQIPVDEIPALTQSLADNKPVIRNIFTMPPKRNPLDKWLRATSYVLASLLIGTLAWQFTHEAVRLSQSGSPLRSEQVVTQNAQSMNGPVNASITSLGALHKNDADGLDSAEQAWAVITQPALVPGESRLQVSVSADGWVEITDTDGKELEMDLLRGGSQKSYQGKPPFRILFGRASAVRLSMDGVAIDLTAYTLDDVAQLSWPPAVQDDTQVAEGALSDR